MIYEHLGVDLRWDQRKQKSSYITESELLCVFAKLESVRSTLKQQMQQYATERRTEKREGKNIPSKKSFEAFNRIQQTVWEW
jgi:Fe-S cluster biosynthesis and repair protein YggX